MEENNSEYEKKNRKSKKVEEKIVDNKVNEPKSKGKGWFILSFILFLLSVGLLSLNIIFNFNKDKENKENKSDVKIKYTTTKASNSTEMHLTDVSSIVDDVMPSIVSITSKTLVDSGMFGPSYYGYSNNYIAEGAGSGVIIGDTDEEIFILTNNHVVEDATTLNVKFIDDKSYDAKVKGVSERKDVAIVTVKKSDIDKDTLEAIKIATLGDSNNIKVGNGVIAIGNALGYGQSVTTGVISALNREVTTDSYTQDMIQIDAAINGGNSGGALLNSNGEVIGINTAKYSNNGLRTSASIEGIGFAIAISDVKDIIDNLIEGKDDEGGVLLGVEGYMTTDGSYLSYNLPTGFYIAKIVDGGNASKTDLEIGNIITKVDGKEISSYSALKKILNNKNKGDQAKLTVKYPKGNKYEEKDITIKFES